MNASNLIEREKLFVAVLILFALSLAYPLLGAAFAAVAIYYLARKTTPFDDSESFIAYALLLQLVVLMVAGAVASFVSFSQPVINATILLMAALVIPLKDRPISGDFKKFLGVLLVVFVVYFIPVFVPGMQTEQGILTPFIFAGEYWFHLSISHEIYNGIIPPENPQLAGTQLLYYWFSHLYNATVAKVIGLDIIPAFRIVPFIALFSVAAGAVLLSKNFFKSPYVPAILISASGPLAAYYLKYGFEMLSFPLIENFVEYRPKTIGTALFFGAFFFYLKSFEDRRYIKYAVLFAAFLPVVSLMDSMVLFAIMAIYFVLKDIKLSVDLNYKEYIASMGIITVSLFNKVALAVALLLILAYFAYKRIRISIKFSLNALSVPLVSILVPVVLSSFYLLPLLSTSGNAFSEESTATVLSGWDSSQSADMATLFIFSRVSKFVGYFGVPLFLLIIFLPWLLRSLDKDCVRIPFILFAISFAIGISFRIIPVLIGSPLPYRLWAIGSEFLKMSLPFFLLNIAFLLNEKVTKKHFIMIFLLLAILSTFAHGYLRTLDKVPYGDGPVYVSDAEMQAFEWIRENTSTGAVFAVRPMDIVGYVGAGGKRLQISPPLVPFAGRRVVIGSDAFSSIYSFEPPAKISEMMADINRLYNSTSVSEKRALLEKYYPDYVYIGPLEMEKYPADGLALFDSVSQKVYDFGGVEIYRVSGA